MDITQDPLYEQSFVIGPDGNRRFSIARYDELTAARSATSPVSKPAPEGAVRRAIWDAWPQAEKEAHVQAGGWVVD
jgi:hypothetical protein